MTLPKLVKIAFGLLVIFAVAIGLTSIDHPIILKWVTGSARHLGTSISATVYTNGEVNDNIKVFYGDDGNHYLLSLTEYDSLGMLRFISVNINENWIGRPAATSKKDYDFIAGHLFQSETGGHYSPFQDDIKGFNFDPQLSFTDKEIRFKVPPGKLKFDSVRIKLP